MENMVIREAEIDDADNSIILIALAGEKIIARAELDGFPGA